VSDVKAPSTLLPNNDKESASSAHKRKLLIGFLSLVVLVGLITAMVYQYRLRFDEFSALKKQITESLTAKDEAALIKLASREFTVGQPEQGSGTIVSPEKVMAKIVRLASPLHWSERLEDFENSRVLSPERGTLQLTFNHTPSGWVWSGVQSISNEEVAFLASEASVAVGTEEKVQYQEIRSDEAKGDEPSMDAPIAPAQ
jgi:hypothetical protein